jgi:uncharacterized protein (UPF0332 family)
MGRHAYRRLDNARYLLDDGRTATATVQVYYALYYARRALLEAEGFSFQRHTSVTSNVGRVARYRRRLNTSFPSVMQYQRERCDYELYVPDGETVEPWLGEAELFAQIIERLL